MDIGPLQELILRIVWERGEMPVPELAEAVNSLFAENYSHKSVANSAEILRRKGLLRRRLVGRVGYYRPGKMRDEYISETWAAALKRGVEAFGAPVASNLVDAVEMADPAAVAELIDELRRRGYIKG